MLNNILKVIATVGITIMIFSHFLLLHKIERNTYKLFCWQSSETWGTLNACYKK